MEKTNIKKLWFEIRIIKQHIDSGGQPLKWNGMLSVLQYFGTITENFASGQPHDL